MANKRPKPEEIVAKLRQIEVLMGQGMPRLEAIRQIGVVEQTYWGNTARRRDTSHRVVLTRTGWLPTWSRWQGSMADMGIAGSRSYCEMPVGLSATGVSSGCGDGRD